LKNSNLFFLHFKRCFNLTNVNYSIFREDTGYSATSANHFIGNQAGYSATSASNSNFIGYQAGYSCNSAYFKFLWLSLRISTFQKMYSGQIFGTNTGDGQKNAYIQISG
jgi:hypothetical protein